MTSKAHLLPSIILRTFLERRPIISHIPLDHLVAQRDIHSSSANQLYCVPFPSNQNLLHHLSCRTLEAWHRESSAQMARNCSSLAMIQTLRWQLMDKMLQLYLYIHFVISENKVDSIKQIHFQEWVVRYIMILDQ